MKPELLKSLSLEIDYSRVLCLGTDQKTDTWVLGTPKALLIVTCAEHSYNEHIVSCKLPLTSMQDVHAACDNNDNFILL